MSFSINRSNIAKVNKDGVELLSRKKYHLAINGLDMNAVHRLFEEGMEP